MASKKNILFAVSEFAGIVKTGGLADVAGALAPFMRDMGHDIRVVMPAYTEALKALATDVVAKGEVRLNAFSPLGFAIRQGEYGGVPIYLIEHDHYFDREGIYSYGGEGFDDNAERFAFFCAAALQSCQVLDFQPDIIHGHDWQSALLPFYLKVHEGSNPFFQRTRTVLTIHNGAYQQHTPSTLLPALGINPQWMTPDYFEDHGRINLLKGGIVFSDKITTVSPRYAEEMLTELGSHGLSGCIRNRAQDFSGILNGCDYSEWNPATDKLIPANYSLKELSGKAECKGALQEELHLPVRSDKPLYGLVSRLTDQKGFDYLIPALWKFLHEDVQVVLLGSGDKKVAHELDWMALAFPEKCRFVNGYNNQLAHKIEAASDFFLMPSLFEPCGLNQLYSMKYGTLPVVRHVGGLADTVAHHETGFVFHEPHYHELHNCLLDTVATYHDKPGMSTMISKAMGQSFTWGQSARDYLAVYEDALF